MSNDFKVRDFQCFIEQSAGINPKLNAAMHQSWNGSVVKLTMLFRLLTSMALSTSAANGVSSDCVLRVWLLGDANANDNLAVGDVTTTVNHILGREVAKFEEVPADVNRDGDVTLADAVGIVNILLGTFDKTAPMALASRFSSASDKLTNATEYTDALSLKISNPKNYVALQFDLKVPEDVEIKDVRMPEGTDHLIAYNYLEDNTVRLVVYSLTNTPLTANGVATIEFKSDKVVAATVDVNDVVLADNRMNECYVEGGTYNIQLGVPTGIDAVDAFDGLEEIAVYNMAGVMLYKGAACDAKVAPGLYIVRKGDECFKVNVR